MFDVPVFIPCGRPWWVGSCHIEAGLIILEGMTDMRDAVVRNIEGCSYLLEDVTEREKDMYA